MKKPQTKIPTGKVHRASKMISTGAKVGGNYVKYFAKKALGNEHAKEELDEANANDIYETLSTLKGGALKAAQIMSMDRSFLPKAYQEKFAQAQYKVPPLSYPLVVKTFKSNFSKSPTEIFDSFTKDAVNAASIGQVHKATIGNETYAVKVQYPGVAESISSDLKLVRPIAIKVLNLQGRDIDKYFKEVEGKLLEETNYVNELEQSMELTKACSHLHNLIFPTYYPHLSSSKILTMSWIEDAEPLSVFLKTNPSQEIKNKIAQAIWDFYTYQLNVLKAIHADPHPGNFLIKKDGTVAVIDFGCVKRIPDSFYEAYSQFLDESIFTDNTRFTKALYQLEFLLPEDSPQEIETFTALFKKMIPMFSLPFRSGVFHFGETNFMNTINEMGKSISTDKELRKLNTARGSKHLLYVNRTNFGLFSIMDDLKATINNHFAK